MGPIAGGCFFGIASLLPFLFGAKLELDVGRGLDVRLQVVVRPGFAKWPISVASILHPQAESSLGFGGHWSLRPHPPFGLLFGFVLPCLQLGQRHDVVQNRFDRRVAPADLDGQRIRHFKPWIGA